MVVRAAVLAVCLLAGGSDAADERTPVQVEMLDVRSVPPGDVVERFLTPGYPRTLSVALTLRRPPSPR